MNSEQIQQEEPITTGANTPENGEGTPETVATQTEEKAEIVEAVLPNYADYSKVELINALQTLLNSEDLLKRRDEIELIRESFYKIRNAEIEKEKEIFEASKEEGEEKLDFRPTPDPYEQDIKRLVGEFHKLRVANAKALEETRANNLKLKKAIIEQIKELGENASNVHKSFDEFKKLQKQFKELGSVPQGEVRGLWDSYHHAVEVFFSFVHIDRELRDIDLKKNKQEKLELVKLAEKLGKNDDVIDAFFRLQNLHEKWKEIGPVPHEEREEIWAKFSAASQVVNDRHHKYYDALREKQKQQLAQKEELCAKAEAIRDGSYETIKEIRSATDKILDLQKIWKELGPMHSKDGRLVWERFRAINDQFFEKKRAIEDKAQEGFLENLKKKQEMCERAEKLSSSEDWKVTTQKLIDLQKKWTKIGPVPRKDNEKIWQRFRKACDLFFERKTEHFNKRGEGEIENLEKKEALIEEVKQFEPTGGVRSDLAKLKEFQERWNAIGFVPIKKKEKITLAFRKAVNERYEKINMDETQKNILSLKIQLDDLAAAQDGKKKILKEREVQQRKHRQVESEKQTIENNIGFFKGNTNNPLFANHTDKIKKIDKQLETIELKIKLIDEMLDELQ